MESPCTTSCTITGTSAGTPPNGQAGATNLPSGPATSDRGAGRIPGRGGFCSRETTYASCTSPSLALAVVGPRGALCCAGHPTLRCWCRHNEWTRRCLLQCRGGSIVASSRGASRWCSAVRTCALRSPLAEQPVRTKRLVVVVVVTNSTTGADQNADAMDSTHCAGERNSGAGAMDSTPGAVEPCP